MCCCHTTFESPEKPDQTAQVMLCLIKEPHFEYFLHTLAQVGKQFSDAALHTETVHPAALFSIQRLDPVAAA